MAGTVALSNVQVRYHLYRAVVLALMDQYLAVQLEKISGMLTDSLIVVTITLTCQLCFVQMKQILHVFILQAHPAQQVLHLPAAHHQEDQLQALLQAVECHQAQVAGQHHQAVEHQELA